MKKVYRNLKTAFFIFSMLAGGTALAQEAAKDSVKNKDFGLSKTVGKQDYDYYGKVIKYPRVFGGLTFSRIDWGFSRLIDDGSFTLSENNKFLDYGKASNFGFDIAQFGLRTSDAFKIYISTGFEWNYLRLKKNVILDTEKTPLAYEDSDVNYKKNIFTSTYLRAPITFEWRGPRNGKGNRAKVAAGLMTGILLKGSQRFKSSEHGKQGIKDNFNLASFQYGAFARVGFGSMAVFSKYYINDVFENSPDQKGLNNLTFGLTLGF